MHFSQKPVLAPPCLSRVSERMTSADRLERLDPGVVCSVYAGLMSSRDLPSHWLPLPLSTQFTELSSQTGGISYDRFPSFIISAVVQDTCERPSSWLGRRFCRSLSVVALSLLLLCRCALSLLLLCRCALSLLLLCRCALSLLLLSRCCCSVAVLSRSCCSVAVLSHCCCSVAVLSHCCCSVAVLSHCVRCSPTPAHRMLFSNYVFKEVNCCAKREVFVYQFYLYFVVVVGRGMTDGRRCLPDWCFLYIFAFCSFCLS